MTKGKTFETNKQGVTITKDTVEGLMEIVRNLYLADDIPWVIGYSGGKDSTATLQLVWLSLLALPKEKRKKIVHIINTDTMVESPVIEKWVTKSLSVMDISAKNAIRKQAEIIQRPLRQRLWMN